MRTASIVVGYLVFGLSILLFVGTKPTQELAAKEIVKRADDNIRGNTSQADVTIQIIRPSWQREMEMKAWTKGDDYTLILVQAPAKEKGIIFLKRDKEVWNWIPAIEHDY